MLKYYATNTDSTDRIARGHNNLLKIKLIRRERAEYVCLENIVIFLEHDYKLEYALKILIGNYKVFLNICRNICKNYILNVRY